MEHFDSGNRKNGFDRDWRFMPDLPPLCDDCHGNTDVYSVTRTGKRCRYAVSGFDDSGWRKVHLPHDWLVGQDFDTGGLNAQGFFRRGYAWYRKEFRLLSDCRGKQILLCFDGIAGKSEIYINGSLIKRNFSSYNTFTVDITDRVYHGDRTNTVAVFVDRRDVELWAYEGAGIHRHAWLYIKDAVHIAHDGLFVTSRPESGGRWKVTAGITAENSLYTDTGYDVAISVSDASGNIVGTADAHGIAPADGRSVVTSGFYVDSPALWDTDSPTLYTVSAELSYSGGKDREACVHGFRTFSADPEKGFFLNGEHIKFYGVCCHQGHAGVGTAVPDSIVAYRMKKLKELGINGFRCVHHNPSPELLDECDRLGILVIDENRNFESGEEYIGYIEDMVRRDRNHPSIVMYALFNEEPIAEFPEGGNIYRRLASAVKRLDSTRLLTGAMNEDSAFGEGGAGTLMDVTGINYALYNFEKFHRLHPEKPLLGTENAATFGTRGQYVTDISKRMIACDDTVHMDCFNTVRETFRAVDGSDYIAGMCLWSGYDYRGESMPDGWPAVTSQFGIMDSCGFPKGGYWFVRAFLKKEPFVKILQHWNHTPGEILDFATVTNCDEVELTVNGTPVGRKTSEPYTQLRWKAEYQPGEIKAVGYRDGLPVAEETVRTASAPAALILEPDRTALSADGADTVSVTVYAVDKDGNPVPDADNLIRFSVTGGAQIAGCGNGDPTSHENDTLPERRLFAGMCAVLVRSGEKDETICLSAESDGLTAGHAVLTVGKC